MAKSRSSAVFVGPAASVDCRYVMTDCSQKMIKWLKQNHFLEPFIKEGLMDVAFYDAENPQNVVSLYWCDR